MAIYVCIEFERTTVGRFQVVTHASRLVVVCHSDVHLIHSVVNLWPRRRTAGFILFADTMSRMESVQQSSQAPTALPGDVVSALHTLHEFVATSMSIPPQVIVTCRDEKRAFGRAALCRKQWTCSLPDLPRRKT
ncbi:hypothetical protein BDR04DRAFT_1102721 [Suillus decipiens]|nr:hypothetical protein BDR04DRAFT_1102721 [Suillus decipiens]